MAEAGKEVAPAPVESVQDKEADRDENPAAVNSEEVVTEQIDEIPLAEESIPAAEVSAVTEKIDEIPVAEESIPAAEVSAITEKINEISVAEESVPAVEVSASAPEENIETSEQEDAEVQGVSEEKPEIQIETAPADFRFPTTNQTRHCFTRYIEYHRCIAAKGEGASECDKFAKYYRSLCPSEWVERWNEQRENGTFPGPL